MKLKISSTINEIRITTQVISCLVLSISFSTHLLGRDYSSDRYLLAGTNELTGSAGEVILPRANYYTGEMINGATLEVSSNVSLLISGDINPPLAVLDSNANTSTSYATDTFQINEQDVTVGDYCNFLKAVATVDTYDLYADVMGKDTGSNGGPFIYRSGFPNNRSYEAVDRKKGEPITGVNIFNMIRYCNWVKNGQPRGAQDTSTTESGVYLLNDNSFGKCLGYQLIAGADYTLTNKQTIGNNSVFTLNNLSYAPNSTLMIQSGAELVLSNNYTSASIATLNIVIDPTNSNAPTPVVISNKAILNGTLQISFPDGTTEASVSGDVFPIMTSAGFNGDFSSITTTVPCVRISGIIQTNLTGEPTYSVTLEGL